MAEPLNNATRGMDVIAVIPPPLNGMTFVTSKMLAILSGELAAQNKTVSDVPEQRRGLKWTAAKHWGLLRSIVVGGIKSRGRNNCYFILDSQAGLWLNVVEALLLRLGYNQVWLHHHVFSYFAKRDLRLKIILAVLGNKTRHIVLGHKMRTKLQQHYAVESAFILGNAAFLAGMPAPTVRSAVKNIGFLGNITRTKGIGLYMQVVRAVQAVNPLVSSSIAGPIHDAKLRAEVEQFCAEAPVSRKWLGPVSGDSKRCFYQEIDILLFPTLYENEALPVTIYEGLASGAPVLATNKGCIAEQLSGTDWLFGDEEFTRKAPGYILSLAGDPSRFQVESEQALQAFAQHKKVDEQRLSAVVSSMAAG